MNATTRPTAPTFRHGAYLYTGHDAFLDGALPFIQDGLAHDEPVLVATNPTKIEMLRAALATDSRRICFVDMLELGRNPGRFVSAWQYFLTRHAATGHRVRGIGEQIWAGRRTAELVECQRHEVLLNTVCDRTPAGQLLCLYDVTALPPSVVEEAHRSHPYLLQGGIPHPSIHFTGADTTRLDQPLSEPTPPVHELLFHAQTLSAVRRTIARHPTTAGLTTEQREDLALSAHELAANSLRHGGGQGLLRLWREDNTVICEIRDHGRLSDPFAGHRLPGSAHLGGRGLWPVDQLCDLVQVRTSPTGTTVRVHMHCHAPPRLDRTTPTPRADGRHRAPTGHPSRAEHP